MEIGSTLLYGTLLARKSSMLLDLFTTDHLMELCWCTISQMKIRSKK
ncbi:unnamed protein product [Acanthoscelides obtectus]|uniref:Uncharacterized protein n=1 Tax=Acanthoscelides obtectus TaxID=200917 RepID=A0A9P0PFC2_ACAOB|nr:unnamed protein product [Acanthoscelides obtectus]CAK1681471.1 hypothetical protein AOBTE_LOCUS33139 [Acanthoscelides obtectus]